MTTDLEHIVDPICEQYLPADASDLGIRMLTLNSPDDVLEIERSEMNSDSDRPLEERFLEEMVEGYLDGRKPDNPEPSLNRSNSYRHGFANGRDALAAWPRFPAAVLRLLADQAIREDVARAEGGISIKGRR